MTDLPDDPTRTLPEPLPVDPGDDPETIAAKLLAAEVEQALKDRQV